MTDIEKLRILIPHWIEHNTGHGTEFKSWSAKARTEGKPGLAAQLEKAEARINEANQELESALALLDDTE